MKKNHSKTKTKTAKKSKETKHTEKKIKKT